MTATNKPMTGAQLDELMAVAMRMQSDSEKMGERSVSIFAYAVQVAVLEIRETRCKYEELQSQNADMAVQLANTESKCRELAAELSAVDKIHNEAVFITDDHYEQCPPEVQKMIRSLAVLQIPAYDAFLAEARAQVWIEGSEPEEFGRYWVRYETDVGPQYCSAEWMEYNFCAGSNTNIHKIWLADHSRSINSLRGVTHYTKLPDSLEGAAQ
jgi:hypothetical protein